MPSSFGLSVFSFSVFLRLVRWLAPYLRAGIGVLCVCVSQSVFKATLYQVFKTIFNLTAVTRSPVTSGPRHYPYLSLLPSSFALVVFLCLSF